MHSTKLRFLPFLLLTAALAFPVRLASAAVSDGAHIFGADAIAQTDSIDRDIRQRHGLDFNLETFNSVPSDRQPDLQSQGREQFFKAWATQRFRDTGTNGVYVLICMDPHYIQPNVGTTTEQRAFTAADRDQLGQILRNAFKNKDYDRGLTEAAQFVRSRMDANLGARAGTSSGSTGVPGYGGGAPTYGGGRSTSIGTGGGIPIFGWFCLIVGVLAIFAIIRGIINRPTMMGGGGGYPPPPGYQGGAYPGGYSPGYGGGGGGFGRGLLGGILGGALGSAGYDWLSGRDRGGSWGGGQSTPSGGGFDPNAGGQLPNVDTSSDPGGGGGWDSSSGGGADLGGGGGDTGGGADFGGGGGGDSGGSGGGDF